MTIFFLFSPPHLRKLTAHPSLLASFCLRSVVATKTASIMEALVHMRKLRKPVLAAEYWVSDAVSTYDRHVVVKQLCFTKQAGHVDLAHAIILVILKDPSAIRLHCSWVLLLCVTLARTHDPVFLEPIVRLKNSLTDLSMAVDSTLLFEFSPRGNRTTAVEDTLAWVNNPSKFPYKGAVGELIRATISKYAQQYGSDVVVRAWDRYRDVAAFSKRFDLSNEQELKHATLTGY